MTPGHPMPLKNAVWRLFVRFIALQKTPFSPQLSCVRPEPVLAKRSFLYKTVAQKGVFHTTGLWCEPCGAAPAIDRQNGPLTNRTHGPSRQDKTWHDMTWRDKTRQDKTRHDMTWQDMTWRDKTWHDMTRQDRQQPRRSREGEEWRRRHFLISDIVFLI